MSYSFSVRSANKAAAKLAIAAKFAEIVASQPSHETDRSQVLAAADAFVDLLPEREEDRDVVVSVSGSIGWSGSWGGDASITHASVTVNAYLASKELPAS